MWTQKRESPLYIVIDIKIINCFPNSYITYKIILMILASVA